MNKDTARDPLTQRILDLTLEIIFLLTGEDHMVVKSHEMVTDNSHHQISGGYRRSQSFNTKPPPHSAIHEQNNEKILELTNKIIRLLTGEVPIRCEDVTVYLSMEEWEYVERHKELYKDVVMGDHQPIVTLDKSVSGELHSPVSFSDFGTEYKTSCGEKYLKKARKWRAECVTSPEAESLAFEERYVPEKNIYPTTEYTEYSPTDIKEEPDSCEEENLADTDIYNPTENTQTKYTSTDTGAESDSHREGDKQSHLISHPYLYPSPEHTQHEYPSTAIKKESPIYEEGNVAFNDIYKPPRKTKRTADSFGESLKANTNLMKISTSESSFETDLVIYEKICRAEPISPTSCGEISTTESSFKLPECEKPFTNTFVLENHQRIHTGKKKTSQCTECGKCFTGPAHLARHKLIHKGEKLYKCPECGKCFISLTQLARHKRIHTGEKPFKCNECGKCFLEAGPLSKHKLIHTGEKPFNCTECGKWFRRTSNLAAHKMIHTGEKPFICSDCGKCFTRASTLRAHSRIHTGEKPFICTECGRRFNQPSNLTKHKMIHREQNTFQCF